jgi:hypothetical protein
MCMEILFLTLPCVESIIYFLLGEGLRMLRRMTCQPKAKENPYKMD